MMQQPEIVASIKSKYPQVDLIFGTHNIHRLPEFLNNFSLNGNRMIEVWEDSDTIIEDLPVQHKYPFKAFVTIMNGCNNFCTYCIVPYTRGREVSRRPEKIIEEVQALADSGCLEITLLGQNVNSYGNDLEETVTFAALLKDLSQVEGIERIRFMTSHPKDLTDEVIETIAKYDKICNYIHLPIQSGSSRILKKMNRKYSREDVINRVEKIRELIPGVSITTDIIVGFPGETDQDHQDTLDLIKTCRFDSAFTFMYSIRTGTPAATMADQIPDAIKHQRLNECLEILRDLSHECNAPYQNQIVKVLAEETSKNNPNRLSGRTETGKLVNFSAGQEAIGQIVHVKITTAKSFSLDGEMIEGD
jgi:tRNA-2-methylthio-N6-dimethylallyladenosine synthase